MNIDPFRATIVSLVPFEIREHKVGIYPGDYYLPASKDDEPEILVIGEATHYVYLGEDRGYLPVRIPAHHVAQSIVFDYANTQVAVTDGALPAIFWVMGSQDKETIKKECKAQIAEALQKQRNWFLKLVAMADDDWERYKRHVVISDVQRYAAKALGMERPWILAIPKKTLEPTLCSVCKSAIHPEAIVCPMCKAILRPEERKLHEFAG